jgi:hypothetical protein
MLKIFVVCLAIFVSASAYAKIEEDEVIPPMHYALLPSLGLSLPISELSGSKSLNAAFAFGVGFRFWRDGYFFTPQFRILEVSGLSTGGAVMMWTGGFTAGGRLKDPDMDIFVGIDWADFKDYIVAGNIIGKVGVIFDLGNDFQIPIDFFY